MSRIKKQILNKLKEYASKMGTNTMGGDDYTTSRKGGLRDFDGYDNVDYNKDMPMDESVSPQVLKVLNLGLKKINRKFKGASLDGKTIDIELHPGHNRDSEIYQVYDLLKKLKLNKHKTSIFNEGMFSTIDQIRQDSKDVRDFVKKVFKDKEFKKMSNDKEFIKYLKSIYEGVHENFPANWLQGRTSDYHTKLRGKKREKYDDTNFDKKNSGQEDLEEYGSRLTEPFLLPKDEDKLDGTPPSKDAINKESAKKKTEKNYKDWKSTNETAKRDYKDEYKKFQSSKKSKKYRAELNKYNRQKGTYGNGDGKDASHKGGKIVGFESASKNRGRKEKSRLKKESVAINEIGVFPITNYMNGIVPSNFINTTTPKKKEKLKSTLRDLKNTLNRFWKQHNIPYRIK